MFRKSMIVLFLVSFLMLFYGSMASHASISASPKYALFVGDSFCSGTQDVQKNATWAYIVSQALKSKPIIACLGGTGYNATAGFTACGQKICGNYFTQISKPLSVNKKFVKVVLISGGKNDLGFNGTFSEGVLFKKIDLTFKRAKSIFGSSRIIVISPFWTSEPVPPGLNWEVGLIRESARLNDLEFIAGSELIFQSHPELLNSSNHPTLDGHRVIADFIIKSLSMTP